MTETVDDDMRRVFQKATEHEGRFLLLTRDSHSVDYHACQRLVFGGYAKEISQWSDMRPGIELTGKPLPGCHPGRAASEHGTDTGEV